MTKAKTVDNRDFVLGYRIAGRTVEAGLLAHRDQTNGYFSLMIEPPAVVDDSNVTPREIVFVLDTSGSMSGKPLAASKLFMRHSLKALRPNDYFRIIRFSNAASEFSTGPVQATPGNLARGLTFVESLRASGGTEVITALNQAFGTRQAAGTRRLVVFLSDGYVGNEAEILSMVSRHIGQARTYALGVGTSVNRYLLAEMAHHGRGYVRFIDPTEKVEDAAIKFANKLAHTVMTDLEIDWGDLKPADVVPAQLPDLFAGDAIRVHGRFRKGGVHTIKVKGKVNGREAILPIKINLPVRPTGEETKAIPLTWARAEIKDLMRRIMAPAHKRRPGNSTTDLETRVTNLGLRHSLVTQWTSFVAVSQRIINHDPAATHDSSVPLPMVKGIGPKAYGKQQASAPAAPRLQQARAARKVRIATNRTVSNFGNGFASGSTPEPEHLLGLLTVLLILMGGGGWLRRRST